MLLLLLVLWLVLLLLLLLLWLLMGVLRVVLMLGRRNVLVRRSIVGTLLVLGRWYRLD